MKNIHLLNSKMFDENSISTVAELSKTMSAFQQQLSPAAYALANFSALLQSQLSPSLTALGRSAAMLNKQLSPSLLALSTSTTLIQNQLSSSLLAFSKSAFILQEQLSPTLNSLSKMAFLDIGQSLRPMQGIIESMVVLQQKVLQQMGNESFEFEADGTISVTDKRYDITNIQEKINECIENSNFLRAEIALEKRIANFFIEIAKQHPVLAFAIVSILIPIWVNIYSSKFTSSIPNTYNINNINVYISVIKNQPKVSGIPKQHYRKLRFVTASYLEVRNGSSKKSRVIGNLYLGQVVEVVYKRKNWTFIKWVDLEDGTNNQGWVFTRYIKKFEAY